MSIISVNVLTGETTQRALTPEEIAAIPPEMPAPIPRRVTMRQARLALLGAGLLEQIDTAINAIPDETERKAAKINWEYAQEVDRDHQWVQGLSVALELSEAQLDALFTQAAAL
jgi:hypothetical protein